MEETRTHKNINEISEGNKPLGRPRHRWEDFVKMELKYGVRMWNALSRSEYNPVATLMSTVMNLRIP
jgi:hypothetical protein